MTPGRSKSIAIAGGGIVGLCSAYYCVQRGHRVTVLDRRQCEGDCCSRGNAGMVCPSHFIPLASPGMVWTGLKMMLNRRSPFYIKPRLDGALLDWALKFAGSCTVEHVERSGPLLRDLNLASRECFVELREQLEFGLVEKGLLMLCKTEHAFEEERSVAAQAKRLGMPAEVLSARELAALEPNVRMDVAGAVYFPKDCHLSPSTLVTAMQRECERMGVTFRWAAEVIGWERQDGHVRAAKTTDGEVHADEFVICGGSWSPEMARALAVKLPMQAGKGYSLTLPNPRQAPVISSILTEARVAVTPMDGGLRFAGTMEIAGTDERINPERVRGIIASVPNYYPEFSPADFEGVKPWAGLRPVTPDGLPYLGRVQGYENLTLATGHAMMGLSLGPITGKIVAQLLSGDRPEIDLRLLRPDRYS